ncbi:unnamed protein product [Ilex paraguariensis]|uniref:non-specific serine/threonine protein kinase n=1 Tax=Ilex paraguariensis TaxID=185542 RepID=A0ABC8UUG2_9AQUA
MTFCSNSHIWMLFFSFRKVMEHLPYFTFFYALIFSSSFLEFSVAATDTIIPGQSISDGQTLVSSSQRFELGFFSSGRFENKYLGIWYKATPDTIVWTANRNNPIKDSKGVLTISSNGTLVLLNGTQTTIWSANLSKTAVSPAAQLLDTGNFVSLDKASKSSESYMWQSFDFPSNTLLPGMKGSVKKYRSGPWNGVRFSGLPTINNPVFRPIMVFNESRLISVSEPYNNSVIARSVLNQSGLLEQYLMDEKGDKWTLTFNEPSEPCDNYGQCGPNGICSINESPICDCLKGFTPKSPHRWQLLDWSSGCVRKTPLECKKGEGFIKVAGVKVPDLLEFQLNTSMSLAECKAQCLNNCSCTANANSYISGGGSGCLIWFGDLTDIKKFIAEESEQDIYIRLPASELGKWVTF